MENIYLTGNLGIHYLWYYIYSRIKLLTTFDIMHLNVIRTQYFMLNKYNIKFHMHSLFNYSMLITFLIYQQFKFYTFFNPHSLILFIFLMTLVSGPAFTHLN